MVLLKIYTMINAEKYKQVYIDNKSFIIQHFIKFLFIGLLKTEKKTFKMQMTSTKKHF